MPRTRRRSPARKRADVAPCVVTIDGMAWCTRCGWEPDTDTTYLPLVVMYAAQHAHTPGACEAQLAARRAAMARHPSTGPR